MDAVKEMTYSNVIYESGDHLDSLIAFAEQTKAKIGYIPALSLLIDNFIKAAILYYQHGIKLLESNGKTNDAYHRNQLIEHIGEEWSNLASLLSTAQTLPKNDKTLIALNAVINCALEDIKLTSSRAVSVLPHFGRHFELVTFHYAPQVSLLGIPVTSLYCPWEWTMVWHEVAGMMVQAGEAKGVVDAIVEKLKSFPEQVWLAWQDCYTEIVNLPKHEQVTFRPADRILQNWAEEMIEDAVGVLCLGDTMATALKEILSQYYKEPVKRPPREEKTNERVTAPAAEGLEAGAGQVAESHVDERHPPAGLRVEIASGLSHLLTRSNTAASLASASKIGQMPGAYQDAGDPATSEIAQIIFNHNDSLVRRKFEPENAEKVNAAVNLFIDTNEQGQPVPRAAKTGRPKPVFIAVPAAREAFNQLKKTTGEKGFKNQFLQVIQRRMTKSPVSQASPVIDGDLPDEFKAELVKIDRFDKLLDFNFSRVDQGTAKERGSHSHNNGFAQISIEYSGISTSHGPHQGIAQHNHPG
jgi:hypothetical protein